MIIDDANADDYVDSLQKDNQEKVEVVVVEKETQCLMLENLMLVLLQIDPMMILIDDLVGGGGGGDID